MRKLTFGIYAGTIWNLLAASTVLADNCSSPGDCLQTAGYNAMVAIVGGGLGIVTALFGSRLADLLGEGMREIIKELPSTKVPDILVSTAEAAVGIPLPLPPAVPRLPFPPTTIYFEQPPGDLGGPTPGQPPGVNVSTSTTHGRDGADDNLDDFEKDIGDEMLLSVESYQQIAKDAARKYFYDCGLSVREVAKNMGHGLPEHHLGNGIPEMQANDLIGYMRNHWEKVGDMQTAKELADQGLLVIAGLPKEGKSGHVAAIVPGEGDTREGVTYPNVAGGSTKYHEGNPLPKEQVGQPYSEGGRTVRDSFGIDKKTLDGIEYFTPKNATTSSSEVNH